MADNAVTLTLSNNESLSLPIQHPSLGQDVVDIKSLGSQLYTYDPGFGVTAACESKITFIDGDKGVLLHRGYPISQLAEHSDFMEVSYLLNHGELPSNDEKQNFIDSIKAAQQVDENVANIFNGFARDAHPMAMLISALGALAGQYHEGINLDDAASRYQATINLVAQIPTLAAMCHKHNISQNFIAPDAELDYAANFLNMLFHDEQDDSPISPLLAKAMDKIFILHADHEQNASTSTVRLVGSTGADPYASLAAGAAALWGPAHGGANEACLNMLKHIGDAKHIPEYIAKAKDKNDPFRLMGFGHRVYKNYDPRAIVMRKTTHDVLEELNLHNNPLFKIAIQLEKIALEDDYFIEKKLYPNVDFYSGITLSALGIPTNMFTVIFALARTIGWMSHWNEMHEMGFRIGRPRQLYTGETQRDYPV